MSTQFEEKQYFRQWWIWLILMGTLGIILYAFVQQVIFGQEVGNNPASSTAIVILLLFMLSICIFFYTLRLDTRIDDNGVAYRWYPFMGKNFKTIAWQEIKEQELIQYGFVGYGIRFSFQYGTVHNANGNKGLQIKTRKNKKILIGTQKEKELASVLKSLDKL